MNTLRKKYTKKQKKGIKKRLNTKKNNRHKRYKKYYGGNLFDISGASGLLATLNELLRAKCPELEIRVGMMSDMTGELSVYPTKSKVKCVLFCLYYRDNCISSFQLFKNGDNIEIRSFTHNDFQRKRYNLLLTYTVFMLTGIGTNLLSVNVNTLCSHLTHLSK
jgi:hypothetical protein